MYRQGRRNSIISGEATSNIANYLPFFPKKLVCQPLISGEAAASPASPIPTPLFITPKNISITEIDLTFQNVTRLTFSLIQQGWCSGFFLVSGFPFHHFFSFCKQTP